jgi:hypothetical protein
MIGCGQPGGRPIDMERRRRGARLCVPSLLTAGPHSRRPAFCLWRLRWRSMLKSRMMRRTVAAQGMMGRKMAERMVGRQMVRGRRRRSLLRDSVTGEA